MQLWRLCKQRYAATAFTGEGSRITSGRWNEAGTPMVYTSTSLPLALLEVFVNMDLSENPTDYVSIAATVPIEEQWFVEQQRWVLAQLPPDWRLIKTPSLRTLGTSWIASNRSLLLPVPSAVVPGEWNVLINPLHPQFSQVEVDEPSPFAFDARMFR